MERDTNIKYLVATAKSIGNILDAYCEVPYRIKGFINKRDKGFEVGANFSESFFIREVEKALSEVVLGISPAER